MAGASFADLRPPTMAGHAHTVLKSAGDRTVTELSGAR